MFLIFLGKFSQFMYSWNESSLVNIVYDVIEQTRMTNTEQVLHMFISWKSVKAFQLIEDELFVVRLAQGCSVEL